MVITLPEHDHCKFCDNPVPFELAFCSEECHANEQLRAKKEKNKNNMYYVIAVVGIVVIFAVALIF